MVFQSYIFFAFLALTLGGWWLLGRLEDKRPRRLWLLAACVVFYVYSSPAALLLLGAEGLCTWLLGRAMLRWPERKKLFLLGGAAALVLILGRFKYASFFLDSLNALLGTDWAVAKLALPLGLSFVTFQQIFYLRDCYFGEIQPLGLTDFALWLLFFPTVSSGPITRPGEMAVQFADPARGGFSWDNFGTGLYVFSLGLFKKVLIADTLAKGANWGFARAFQISSADAALTILAYTLQLYFDFSGYCDMAWGIAKMLGFELPRNFDSPYRAVSVGDFWSRWHITLSRFFRTCVYIPLGGNRKGMARTCLNLMIIFLISGLWHGAGWGFILWGALHGGAMVLERLLRGKVKLPRPLGWLLTFLFVNLAWVYFRAPDMATANALIGAVLKFTPYLPSAGFCNSLILPELAAVLDVAGLVLPGGVALLSRALPLLLFPAAMALCLLVPNPIRQGENFKPTAFKTVVCVVALVWSVVSFTGVATFLYVDF